MKRVITFFLSVISVFVVCRAAQCDSIKVYFALNKATFNPTLNNDQALMAKFIDSLAVAAQSGTLDHIVVYGYASPDGPFPFNDRIAARRCAAVADYISRHAGIPMKDIRTCPGGVAWEALRSLVEDNHLTPSRHEVIEILDRYIPDACTDRFKSDLCVKSLKAIDGGDTYAWMLANLFPELRFALAVYTSSRADSPAVLPSDENVYPAIGHTPAEDMVRDTAENMTDGLSEENTGEQSADQSGEQTQTMTEETEEISPPKEISNSLFDRPLHRLAIKTNLLYDAVLVPNLEVEWRVNDNWSVALEGAVGIWGKYDHGRCYRLYMLSPEVKRWIRPRAPWHGFYVGVFAGGGLYDYEKPTKGYRGEGAMGGLSVGYMWPLSRCLSMEAAVGGGYLYSRYKEYVPLEGHHVYQRTKDLNYFGPLKAKLSLVWRLWDQNKSGHRRNETVVQYEK